MTTTEELGLVLLFSGAVLSVVIYVAIVICSVGARKPEPPTEPEQGPWFGGPYPNTPSPGWYGGRCGGGMLRMPTKPKRSGPSSPRSALQEPGRADPGQTQERGSKQ